MQAARHEIKAMLNEAWASPGLPLLVLACISDTTCEPRRKVIQVADDLELGKLHRPWQVRTNICIFSPNGK